ncbi:MAG: mismatch-specific DNA-glycosylase [Chloroflexota bacterium]
MAILPDVLAYSLKVIFCGTAASRQSAAQGAYYAGPGNRFWPTLYRIGLTPIQLQPEAFIQVLQYGIGLTDIVKHASGNDRDLKPVDYQPEALLARLSMYQPRFVAFNGKRAAQAFFDASSLDYGRINQVIGESAVFVLPSTSGAARAYWDETIWFALAKAIQDTDVC